MVKGCAGFLSKARMIIFINPDFVIKTYPGENDNGRMVKDEFSRSNPVSIGNRGDKVAMHPSVQYKALSNYFAGMSMIFLYSMASWSPCNIIGPGSPSLLLRAPPVIPGISWLQIIFIPFATIVTILPVNVMS